MSETSLPVLCNRLNSVIILFVGGGHPTPAARFHDKEVALAMKDREADVVGGAERAEDVPAGGAPTDWMSRIDDDVALDCLAVPGTHDTMTHRCDGYTTTQSLSLVEQLDCGVRFVDIRLRRLADFLSAPSTPSSRAVGGLLPPFRRTCAARASRFNSQPSCYYILFCCGGLY